MDAKTSLALFFLFNNCTPQAAPVDSGPDVQHRYTLGICEQAPWPGLAWVETAAMHGDDLELMVSWDGCIDDDFEVCWSGDLVDTDPLSAEIWVAHTPSEDDCRDDVAKSMSVRLFDLKLDAFDQGADEIEILVDGQVASYTW